MIDGPIYRNEHRTLSWGNADHQTVRPGHVLVDPPEYVAERYGDQLVRIDEDGYIPKYDLENMRLTDARRIAGHADTDEVDGHSSRDEIVAALSPDVSTASEAPEESEPTERNAWQDLEEEHGQTVEELAADSLSRDESPDDDE